MGADLYWEERNFEPKRTVEWLDHDTMVVKKQMFYTYDMRVIYKGKYNKAIEKILKAEGYRFDRRPKKGEEPE